ncbi:DUF4184 family protein [Paenibacillus sp. JDR-2]|uniref:DUF4184 family protein n=1 Tax=Paenibacillus sp. (strain JDR-2) TaxID=324057 RepID=UPI000166522F|nr:DUF4184 family protein [Paenibacillus sp. JDR-2]ACT02184.1 conserved hypothetical protein [Paenibacillus sp. JDR-2]
MPYTLAHPIFAYPLKKINRKLLSVTGLVLGSMGPDMEYFVRLEPYQSIGHTAAGLFLQVIPLSLVLGLLFHYVVKSSLALHLPSLFDLDKRAYHLISGWDMRGSKAMVVYLLSVIIGFYTHILVDGFTHERGYFVHHWDVLNRIVFLNLPLFKILQYSFSLLGLLIITLTVLIKLYQSNPKNEDILTVPSYQKWLYWMVVFLWAVLLTGLKLNASGLPPISILAVAPVSGFCVGLVAASMIYRRT